MIRSNFLKNDRLHLTALRKEDFPYFKKWESDVYYMRHLDTSPAIPGTLESVEKRHQELLSGNTPNDILFVIRLINEDAPIGFIMFDGIQWQHSTAYIAIGIGEAQHRGHGYGFDAMNLMLDFGFNELNLHRVSLTVFDYNAGAIKLYERVGFVHEGTARQAFLRDGQRRDMYTYGLIRDEWIAKQ